MEAPSSEDVGRRGPQLLLDSLGPSAGGVRRCISSDARGGPWGVLVYPSDELAEDEGYRLRFWAEATNSGRLNHRCVAPVVGMSAPNERYPWILHGAFPALSLDEALVAAGGRLPVSLVSGLALALADALFYVHSHGLVYAGLSPESVLLTPSGPQLTGFGLVRAASPEGTRGGPYRVSLRAVFLPSNFPGRDRFPRVTSTRWARYCSMRRVAVCPTPVCLRPSWICPRGWAN